MKNNNDVTDNESNGKHPEIIKLTVVQSKKENNSDQRNEKKRKRRIIWVPIIIYAILPIVFYFEAANKFYSHNYYIGSFIIAITFLLNIRNIHRVWAYLKLEENNTTIWKCLKATMIFVLHWPSSYLMYKSIRNQSEILEDLCFLCSYSRIRMVVAPVCAFRIYTWLKGESSNSAYSSILENVLYIYNNYLIYIIVVGMTFGIINISSLVVNRYRDEIKNKTLLKFILLIITGSRVHIIPMMLYMDLEWALGAMLFGVMIYLCILNIIEGGIIAQFIEMVKNAVSCSCGNGENSSNSNVIRRVKNKTYKLFPCLENVIENKLKFVILVFNISITINCIVKWCIYVAPNDVGEIWYYYFLFFSSVPYFTGVLMFLICYGLSRHNLIIVINGKRNLLPLNVYQII